jgi:hypothetical protein
MGTISFEGCGDVKCNKVLEGQEVGHCADPIKIGQLHALSIFQHSVSLHPTSFLLNIHIAPKNRHLKYKIIMLHMFIFS